MLYRLPPQVKGEGAGARASRPAAGPGMGPGADGFPAAGPAACQSGEKNTHVVSLWPSRGTRTNPAASEAEFLTQLCGRTGAGPLHRARAAPPKVSLDLHASSHPGVARKPKALHLPEESRYSLRGGKKKKKFKQLGTTDRASVYKRLQKGITVTLMIGTLYGGKCLQ
uniref:Uncharacterized protein n=1 Tax=Myotis myotis TaxID=51298 RepID=A0A7J7UCS3_MYOMY|nr:hypothetical protein mMyoMyo1_008751 [Myotis myotis]